MDSSLYPDMDSPPLELKTDEERADYVARVCAAWDFGVLPERETFEMLRGWKDVFARFPIEDSPAYRM